MTEHASQSHRHYEGPPRLEIQRTDERTLNESGRGIPKSVRTHLTGRYGEEGVGWEFEKTAYAQENELKDAMHEPEFKLATEAFMNALRGDGYKLDDGTDARGKIQRYARNPDVGDIVVYPDGDMHHLEQENKKSLGKLDN